MTFSQEVHQSKLPVLYITYDGLTDPLGQSQVLPYLLGIQEEYPDMTILSAEKKDAFEKSHQVIEDTLANTRINWQHINYHRFPPVFSTLYDLYRLWRKAASIGKKGPLIVHCRSYLATLIGLRMKKKYQSKVIFDMRGFWADERVDGGIWDLRNPVFKAIYRYFKRKEKAFFNQSDAVVSLTTSGKNEIIRKYGLPADKIKVIPCCTDRLLFDPENVSEEDSMRLKKELGLLFNDPVLTYLGSIGTWYLLDEMLDFYVHVKKELPQARLLFVTNDPAQGILNKATEKGLTSDDLMVVNARRQDVPKFLKISDVGLFFIKPCYSKIASSPTKMGEFLSMGIPVIGNDQVGDVAEIIEQTSCGLVIREFTPSHYRSCSKMIEGLRKVNPSIIQKAARQYFDLKTGIGAYLNIYRRLS